MQIAAPKQERVPDNSTEALLRDARLHLQHRRWIEAAKGFLQVTRRQPNCFEAFWQLGLILNHLNQCDEALLCLRNAARLAPRHPKVNLVLGAVLKKLGRFEEAAACCRQETQIDPANADAHYNLGLALQNLDRLEEAAAAYQRAVDLRPDYADALVNLGSVLRQQGHPEAAADRFAEAVRQQPQNPEAHWELGSTLLSLGRFEAGWTEYEWRWKLKDFTTAPAQFAQPLWDGSDLGGRRILLHCEQGYGDTIQFARYATLVAARQGRVIVGCPQPLRGLIETIPGVSLVVTSRETLPPFDVHAPLLSLPAIFGTTLQTVPAQVPYLTPPATGFLPGLQKMPGLNVGIAWAGASIHRNDRNRSLALDWFQPLFRMDRIRWHSLQVGSRAADLKRLGLVETLCDLGSRFDDFGDTARAVAALDVVISVDTAVAHLAGALGKPVWTLLPFEAEWRWMTGREDSPWYPTMRLFRQASPGDWKGLLEHVGRELQALSPC
jgi:tetratricopeptide (TPR) repeat protein